MRHSGPIAPRIKHHPLTGEPIEPVGVVNGKIVWPIMGGAPDGDDDDKDDTGGSDDGEPKDDDKDSSSDGEPDTVTKAEFNTLMKRMQAADKRASEAETKLRQADDAKKDDLTKAQDRVTELESEVEDVQKTVKTLRLQNAFLTANKHTWHDADTALGLAETKGFLEDVVSDDGDVDKKALAKSLDRLAKEHAYLVKPDKKKKDDDEPEDGPSGEPAGKRSDNSKDGKARQKQLQDRFPVLNR